MWTLHCVTLSRVCRTLCWFSVMSKHCTVVSCFFFFFLPTYAPTSAILFQAVPLFVILKWAEVIKLVLNDTRFDSANAVIVEQLTQFFFLRSLTFVYISDGTMCGVFDMWLAEDDSTTINVYARAAWCDETLELFWSHFSVVITDCTSMDCWRRGFFHRVQRGLTDAHSC